MRLNLRFVNSFNISFLVWGWGSWNTKICWRERGSGRLGLGFHKFELTGDLQCLSFSGGLLLFKFPLLSPFKLFRSTSGSTRLLGF